MFVGGVTVYDQMNVELLRHTLVQMAQKRQELLVAVPRLAFLFMGQHTRIKLKVEGIKSLVGIAETRLLVPAIQQPLAAAGQFI